MLIIDIDKQVSDNGLPTDQYIKQWASCALIKQGDCEVSIVIVDHNISQTLNRDYLNKDKPTNVLSFPADADPINGRTHLGDIIICAPLVLSEALAQDKKPHAHWAHLTIHGMLHLQGYDHISDNDAHEMETLEIQLLSKLNFANPYAHQQGIIGNDSTTDCTKKNEPISTK